MSARVLTLPVRQAAEAKNGTVPPARRKNTDVRSREYLSEAEVERLRKAAAKGWYGHRDSTAILLCFRHGLRASELCALTWDDVADLAHPNRATLNVRRLKGSVSGAHPLEPDEVSALRRLRQEHPDDVYVFTTERDGPMTPAGFRKSLARLAKAAGLGSLRVHPHMLRHSTGYALANREGVTTRDVAEVLGHANMANTKRYAAVNANRFRGIWRRHK
jgi:type 1 fimbriae regulatory protein FimB/type 1 fimbriae regulatory protein FimE